MSKKGFAYARVSSEGQVENYSIETQLEQIRQYASGNDIEIVREFTENGITGATLNRPALNELRDNISQVDAVIFYDLDRMSRNLVNQIILKDELDKALVEVLFVKGGAVDKTPEGKMLFSMRGMFAEYELAKIGERTSRGRRQRVKNGLFLGGFSSRCYGYDCLDGKRVVNPETSKNVELIFQWFLEGLTLRGITVKLYSLGIQSPEGKPQWPIPTVFRLLRKRDYTGRAVLWGETLTQPTIISLEDFERVQTKLKRNKELSLRNGARNEYLLSGHIFCHKCGRRCIGSNKGNARYYTCSRGSQKVAVNPCPSKAIRADIEEAAWSKITEALRNPEAIRAGLEAVNDQDYEPELIALKARLKYYKSERGRLFDAFRITEDESTFKEKIKTIEESEKQASNRLAEIEGLITTAEQTPTYGDINKACDLVTLNTERLSFVDKRKVLEALRVKVYTGNTIRLEGVLPVVLQGSKV
jgi:site-specific DNA recombinase